MVLRSAPRASDMTAVAIDILVPRSLGLRCVDQIQKLQKNWNSGAIPWNISLWNLRKSEKGNCKDQKPPLMDQRPRCPGSIGEGCAVHPNPAFMAHRECGATDSHARTRLAPTLFRSLFVPVKLPWRPGKPADPKSSVCCLQSG